MMQNIQDQRVLITGGSRGLGLAMVESLLARGAKVTVLARHRAGLGDSERLGADAMQGDATDAALMDGLIADLRPSVLILNTGATPHMGAIDEQSFESFSVVWNTDVKATLHGVQAALKVPMPKGGRVLLVSSGAAMVLSHPAIRPEAMRLSGGYIGAKRAIWRKRCFGTLVGSTALRLPAPGHEFVDALLRPAIDEACQQFGHVCQRVDAVELTGLDQRRHARPVFAALVAAREEAIFSG
jgi:NAD(P)-dependent dehydrogenase (short-subunit alcohol dehydrogenase family)